MSVNKKIVNAVSGAIVEYLKQNNLEDQLHYIAEKLKQESESSTLHVYVPKKLSINEKEKMLKLCMNLKDVKTTNILYHVQPSLLDGVKIIYNDKVWDYSLSNKLSGLVVKNNL